MMKYKYLLICLLACSFNTISAQEFSAKILPGLMNYGGDLQNAGFTFNQSNFSIGVGLAYRVNKLSLRGTLSFGKVAAADSVTAANKPRNLSFASNIIDANLALQYDIFSIDEKNFTPYVFAGIGAYHFNPYTFYNSKKVYLRPLGTEGQGLSMYPDKKKYNLNQFQIPLGVGVKYKLSEHIQIGLEFCSRILFTDYLDDVSTNYPDETALFNARGQTAVDLSFRGNQLDPTLPFPSGKVRGGASHNDNYYTSSFTFIYVFGGQSNSLFGGTGKRSKNSRALDCPKPMRN